MKYQLTVGRTIKPANFESIKVECTQEFDTEDKPDLNKSYKLVEDFVLAKLEEAYIGHEVFMENLIKKAEKAEKARVNKENTTSQPPKKKTVTKPPQTTKPIWTNYSKQPCKPGEEGWAFANMVKDDILNILDYEHEQTGKAEWMKIGNMEYKLSGSKMQLVNRRPIE